MQENKMADLRCSNCEKSVNSREKNGAITISKNCKATGEKISSSATNPKRNDKYFEIRKKCDEFLPRKEYVGQYENFLDKVLGMVEKGKRIKDIVDPL